MIPLFVISAAGADTIPSQTGFGRPTHWLGPLPTPQPNATPMDSESCPEKKNTFPARVPNPPSFSSHPLYLCASYTHRSVIQRIPRVVYKDCFSEYLYPLSASSFVGGLVPNSHKATHTDRRLPSAFLFI